jgi:hypothetical protein
LLLNSFVTLGHPERGGSIVHLKLTKLLAGPLFALIFSTSGNVAAVLIDFDTAPLGPIAVGQFAGLGVTFGNTSVFSQAPFFTSSPNSIISTSGGVLFGIPDAVTASFASPVTSVGIQGINIGFNGLELDAFDAANVLVGSAVVFGTTEGGTAGGGAGEIFGLSVSGAGITHVRIYQVFTTFNDTIVLDDFQFAAPEPATLLLLGLGLAGMAFNRRQRS